MHSVSRWPGTVGPVAGTPPRAPGSVRRTSSLDALRPDGVGGPLVLVGRARDLRTGSDGTAEVLDEATMDLAIDYHAGRTVTGVRCEPPVAGLDALVGVRAGMGFRVALEESAGWLTADGTLLGLLLDDVPVVTLVSGTVVARAARGPAAPAGVPRPGGVAVAARPRGLTVPPIDVCAGWVAGGAMDRNSRLGPIGLLGADTPAPVVDDPADPAGWHPMPPTPPLSLRRRRRLDVAAGPGPGELVIEGLFRDTAVDLDGTEVVIHEYGIDATVDLATGTVRSVTATPRVLPGPDCPVAAASAGRLVGHRLVGLRGALRADMTGTTTCTHLTDQLRALADVHALIGLLPAGG